MIVNRASARIWRAIAKRLRRSERAQGLVEFGVLLPIVLVMMIGVLELVNAYDHYISVVNASRDGARIGAKGVATDAEIRSLVANDLSRLPNGVTPASDITINRTPVPGDAAISVKSCYDHHLLIHLTVVMPDVVRVCSTTTMRMLPTPGP